jgi:sulfocyanin
MRGVSSSFTIIITVITLALIIGASVYTYEQYAIYTSSLHTISSSTSSSTKTTLPYNPSNKTVYITLVSLSSGSNFNYNGTSFGSMVIYVPSGSNLQITYINQESLPHNLNLVKNTTATPTSNIADDGNILLTIGASSSDYTVNGLLNGQSATGTFNDIPTGTYWLACGIIGHAESGMWVVLVASPNVTTPYVVIS